MADARAVAKDAILVTGSSGFIGRELSKTLADSGRVTVALYRHHLPESQTHVYPVCSDMQNPDLLAAPLRGVSTVVHLAWAHNFVGAPSLIQDLSVGNLTPNLRATQNLLTAMERGGAPRLIFVSALGANRNSPMPFLREKYLAEVLVLNSRIKEKIIIRSSVVYGHHDRFLKSVMHLMRMPGIYPVPARVPLLDLTHIEDLIGMIRELSLTKIKAPATLLEFSGSHGHRLEDIFRVVSQRYLKGTRFPLKGFLGSTLLPLFERCSSRQRDEWPLIQEFLALRRSPGMPGATVAEEQPFAELLPKSFRRFGEQSPQGS